MSGGGGSRVDHLVQTGPSLDTEEDVLCARAIRGIKGEESAEEGVKLFGEVGAELALFVEATPGSDLVSELVEVFMEVFIEGVRVAVG